MLSGLMVGLGLTVAVAQVAPAPAPAPAAPNAEVAQVQAELRALMGELNAAVQAHDRAALERIFSPEFVWVHGFGYVDDRETHIAQELATERPPPVPPIDFGPPNQLIVSGDIAILRMPTRPSRNVDRLWGTVIYERRSGRWRILQIQGTVMNPPPAVVTLPVAALDAIAGRYRSDNGAISTIRREGDTLVLTTPTAAPRVLRPIAADRFVNKAGSEWRFTADASGRVTGYSARFPNGREASATRVE